MKPSWTTQFFVEGLNRHYCEPGTVPCTTEEDVRRLGDSTVGPFCWFTRFDNSDFVAEILAMWDGKYIVHLAHRRYPNKPVVLN